MVDKPPSTPKRKAGRPSTYTPEIAQEICVQIATGELSLRKLCQQPGMPMLRTVTNWLAEHDEFARQMAEARELRADGYRDRIEELIEQVASGKIDPQSGRVSIEGLRWLAGIEKPQKYGDRIRAEHVISRGPDTDSESESRQWLNRMLAATVLDAATRSNVVPLLPKKDDSEASG
jgi:hypothetical protein